jgi:adenylate cyclase
VTTLFCDIRGSSQLAEQLAPQELVAALNEHFTAMTQIIFDRQGTLDKYIGDEIMAIFGAPIATGDEAFRAVDTALQIQALNRDLNTLRKSEGRPLIQVGIGIETGDVIAGYIGSPMRMDFTVVGDRVNIAKRLCDLAGPGQVVAGYETWEEIKDRFTGRPIGTVLLKGKERPVTAYEILAPK